MEPTSIGTPLPSLQDVVQSVVQAPTQSHVGIGSTQAAELAEATIPPSEERPCIQGIPLEAICMPDELDAQPLLRNRSELESSNDLIRAVPLCRALLVLGFVMAFSSFLLHHQYGTTRPNFWFMAPAALGPLGLALLYCAKVHRSTLSLDTLLIHFVWGFAFVTFGVWLLQTAFQFLLDFSSVSAPTSDLYSRFCRPLFESLVIYVAIAWASGIQNPFSWDHFQVAHHLAPPPPRRWLISSLLVSLGYVAAVAIRTTQGWLEIHTTEWEPVFLYYVVVLMLCPLNLLCGGITGLVIADAQLRSARGSQCHAQWHPFWLVLALTGITRAATYSVFSLGPRIPESFNRFAVLLLVLVLRLLLSWLLTLQRDVYDLYETVLLLRATPGAREGEEHVVEVAVDGGVVVGVPVVLLPAPTNDAEAGE